MFPRDARIQSESRIIETMSLKNDHSPSLEEAHLPSSLLDIDNSFNKRSQRSVYVYMDIVNNIRARRE